MLQRSKFHSKARFMFSLISLYFAYRRDVVSAERYIAALNKTKAQPAVADTVTPIQVEERLPLAA